MAKQVSIGTLEFENRANTGTTAAKSARHEGKVPGIVYG